jgi:hypothetical protein
MSKHQEKNARFELFWKTYPRHEVKIKARRAFERINPNDETLKDMIKWIEQARYSIQWRDIQFIPMAATFLNQRRWEDDLPPMSEYCRDEWQILDDEIDKQALEQALSKRKEKDPFDEES